MPSLLSLHKLDFLQNFLHLSLCSHFATYNVKKMTIAVIATISLPIFSLHYLELSFTKISKPWCTSWNCCLWLNWLIIIHLSYLSLHVTIWNDKYLLLLYFFCCSFLRNHMKIKNELLSRTLALLHFSKIKDKKKGLLLRYLLKIYLIKCITYVYVVSWIANRLLLIHMILDTISEISALEWRIFANKECL